MLQILFVVPVGVVQKLVAGQQESQRILEPTKKTPWLLPGGTDLKVAVGVLKQCVEVWIVTAVSSLVILVFEQLAVSAGEPVACLAEKLQWLLFVDVAEDGLLGGKAYCFWKTGQDRNCRGNSQECFAIITICFSLVKMYDFLCSCEACYRSLRYRIIFFSPLFDPASFSGLKPQYSLTEIYHIHIHTHHKH